MPTIETKPIPANILAENNCSGTKKIGNIADVDVQTDSSPNYVKALHDYIPACNTEIPFTKGQLIKILNWNLKSWQSHLENAQDYAEGEVQLSSSTSVRGYFPKRLVIPYRKSIVTIDNKLRRFSNVKETDYVRARIRTKSADNANVGSVGKDQFGTLNANGNIQNGRMRKTSATEGTYRNGDTITHVELIGCEKFKDVVTGANVPIFVIRVYSPPTCQIIFRRYSELKELHVALQNNFLSSSVSSNLSAFASNRTLASTLPSSTSLSSSLSKRTNTPADEVSRKGSGSGPGIIKSSTSQNIYADLNQNLNKISRKPSLSDSFGTLAMGSLISLAKQEVKLPDLPAEREVFGWSKNSKEVVRKYLEALISPSFVSSPLVKDFFAASIKDVSLLSTSKVIQKHCTLESPTKGTKPMSKLKRLFRRYSSQFSGTESSDVNDSDVTSGVSDSDVDAKRDMDIKSKVKLKGKEKSKKKNPERKLSIDVDAKVLELEPIQEIIGCYFAASESDLASDIQPISQVPLNDSLDSSKLVDTSRLHRMETMREEESAVQVEVELENEVPNTGAEPTTTTSLARKFKAGQIQFMNRASTASFELLRIDTSIPSPSVSSSKTTTPFPSVTPDDTIDRKNGNHINRSVAALKVPCQIHMVNYIKKSKIKYIIIKCAYPLKPLNQTSLACATIPRTAPTTLDRPETPTSPNSLTSSKIVHVFRTPAAVSDYLHAVVCVATRSIEAEAEAEDMVIKIKKFKKKYGLKKKLKERELNKRMEKVGKEELEWMIQTTISSSMRQILLQLYHQYSLSLTSSVSSPANLCKQPKPVASPDKKDLREHKNKETATVIAGSKSEYAGNGSKSEVAVGIESKENKAGLQEKDQWNVIRSFWIQNLDDQVWEVESGLV
ncbi:hypothetical protein BKA69DRAFT_1103673 [Paraphysoderma sedebokerense]|nr:hypothetical protein BKA69DRAFT_1103673 [Paraphysoderma sedebokerense]